MPDRGSLVQAAQQRAVRELLKDLSLAEKRMLLEVLLGVSLPGHTDCERVAAGPTHPVHIDESRAGPRLSGPSLSALTEPLSRREQEVAELIAQGLSNREIADMMVVSVRTVEAHVTHVLNKLGLRSRAQAAVWAAHHLEPSDLPVHPVRIDSVEPTGSTATWRTRRSQMV
jgi:DNA-binding CsgD family transcriptional regulator